MKICPVCEIRLKEGSITIESVCLICAKNIYETYKKLCINKNGCDCKCHNIELCRLNQDLHFDNDIREWVLCPKCKAETPPK